MAVYQNSPPIVTNGLVWYSNPGNPSGYYISSSGTTAILSDFSGTNDSLVLNGTTAYVPSYGGYISYANVYGVGGTSYSTTVTGSAIPPLDNLTAATWNLWIDMLPGDTGIIIGKNDGNSSAGWFLECTSGTGRLNDGIGFEIVNATSNMRAAIPTGSYATGSFINLCMTWDGNTTTATGSAIYVNGSKVPFSYQSSGSGAHNTDVGYPIMIGHMFNSVFLGMSSNLSIAMIYNRQLALAEILQNYNAQKSRFNLT